MRLTRLLAPTLRETPAEAELASHRLMLRAGLLRKVAAGIYTHLPLGHRVLQKVERIVREEMDRAGAQELRLPIVQPAELWQETGRWADYGEEMFRLTDRHGRLFCLGPTHEEIITDLVRTEVRSYRQLPLLLYQIQNKYRDEIRPRFGVMRSREFIMKDAYSFHADEESLERTYRAMYQAYERVFRRLGLEFRAVEADSGAIGGSHTHEFMALADAGEAALLLCPACEYAANAEKAEAVEGERRDPPAGAADPVRVETPGAERVEEVARLLGVPVPAIAKTLFYWAEAGGDGTAPRLVAAVIRGDRALNEIKLKNATGARALRPARFDEVRAATGAPLGSAGPVGLQGAEVWVDLEVAAGGPWVVGANAAGFHLTGAWPGLHFPADRRADLRQVQEDEPCPRCGAPLVGRRGIEVGQVFQLGTKYSAALGAVFLDAEGSERPVIMGCYGIGVSRAVAAIIEQRHDERGIRWPLAVAPYHACILPVNAADPAQREAAERLYGQLLAAGLEVVLDDRDERAGVKFNDADLIGWPFRVTIGPRGLAQGVAEVCEREAGEEHRIPLAEVGSWLARRVEEGLRAAEA